MTRRKRRRGGRHTARRGASGRVTPRGARSADRPRLPATATDDTGFRLDLLIRDAEYIVETYPDMSDLDKVDQWASAIQSEVRSRAAPGGLSAPVVLSRAASAGGPAGAALAAAIAAYGPVEQRDRARRTVERLTADGCDAPVWIAALGAVEPVRAFRLADEWDEYSALDLDFRRPDAGTHRLRIAIYPFRSGAAQPARYFAAGYEESAAAVPDFSSEDISLADARAIAEPGLEILEEVLSDGYDEDDGFDLDPSFDLFALTRQRIGLLPAGGAAPARPQLSAEEIAAPFGEFAGRPLGYGEDADSIHHLVRSLIGFVARCHDVDPLRWTPPRVTAFVEEWLPDNGYYCYDCRELHEPPSYEEWLPTFRSAFVRWLRFTAACGDLPDETRNANVAAAKSSLAKLTGRIGYDEEWLA